VSKYYKTAGLAMSEYDELVARATGLDAASPYMVRSVTVRTDDGAERATITRVGGEFFAVLGIKQTRGRLIDSNDDRVGVEPVAVVSDVFWRRLGDGASDPVGQVLLLDERPFRIVGMIPQSVAYPSESDVWVPLQAVAGALLRATNAPFLRVIGRVRHPEHIDNVRAQVAAIPRSATEAPAVTGQLVAEPLRDHLVKDVRTAITLFVAASAFLMAIACLAAVTIQLAANTRRAREIAIRSTLGASPGRLGRGALREAGIIAVVAGAAGLLLSSLALVVGRTLGATVVAELSAVHLNVRMYVASAILATLAALLVTGVPMLSLLRSSTADLLRGTSHTASLSLHGALLRDGLIGVSVGVTLILILSFVVTTGTLVRLVRTDTGYRTRDVLTATVRFPFQVVTPSEMARIRSSFPSVQTTLAAVNPRATIALSTDTPGNGNQSIVTVGTVGERSGVHVQVGMSQVSGDYFSLLGIPLLSGRTFDRTDDERSPWVVVIDRELGKQLFGNINPLGRLVMVNDLNVTAEVVGIVGTVRQAGRLAEPLPQLYLPIQQLPLATFAVLTRGIPSKDFREQLKLGVSSASPSAAVIDVLPLEDAMYRELRRPTFYAVTLFAFAIAAMVVSGAAVYASVSALVAQRTHEIGIRAALGASRIRIVSFVLKRVGQMTVVGTILGAILGYGLHGLLESRIAALGHPTMTSLVSSVLILWCAAGLAVLVPVLRATRVHPAIALSD
jgi:putative ABC transport system permease protein